MASKAYKLKNWQVIQRQNNPLAIKERISLNRIKLWYEYYNGNVYVSFSGGKDSTVLLHLVRSLYPNVKAVFSNTGLEYDDIKYFVSSVKNVEWIKPKKTFKQVIELYGYPIISKDISGAIYRYRLNPEKNQWRLNNEHAKGYISKRWRYLIDADFKISDYCCYHLKESPLNKYAKKSNCKPMIGIMATESNQRCNQYKRQGCNAFDLKSPVSWPIAFWTDKDVWDYIKKYNIKYSVIYDKGEKRTGCVFCMYGIQYDEIGNNRLQRLKKINRKKYDFCINNLDIGRIAEIMGFNYK